jgi:hypothetical protein
MAIFIGDIGTKIILDVGLDISEATVRKIKYSKPDGGVGDWPAAQETVMSISYITQAGDISISGRWKLQAYIETLTWKRHGEVGMLNIKPILGA